jgi:hypothetical protein
MNDRPDTAYPSHSVRCAIYTLSATDEHENAIEKQELHCRAAAAQKPGDWIVLERVS